MARWLVTQGDRQFSAENLSELKRLANAGKIGPGDMIQPPGASDWLYASELPELRDLLDHPPVQHHDEDVDEPRKGLNLALLIPVFVVFVALGGIGMWYFAQGIKDADYDILGRDGLALTQMLVTEANAPVRAEPSDSARPLNTVAKDSTVQLLAKRGGWYQVDASGTKGWMAVNHVVPAYYFADEETRQDYDPIYNPDRYLFVKNSDWKLLPSEESDDVTIFQFLLQNKSKFEMTDIVLQATIKDKNDRVLETKEIPIEGSVPAFANAWVGTLNPPEDAKEETPRSMTDSLFQEIAKDDEDMNLRWSDGIEVVMDSEGFVEANIDLVQIRAVARKL